MDEDNFSNFKCLSANDLSIEHFLSAKEDTDNNQSNRSRSTLESIQAKYPHISSSALVDSDNEESFDEINDGELGHTSRRAEFVVGDSDEPTRADLQQQQQQQPQVTSERVSRSRLMWQRHSLLSRSHALQQQQQTADEYDEQSDNDNGDKLVRASTAGGNIGNSSGEEALRASGPTCGKRELTSRAAEQLLSSHNNNNEAGSNQKILIRINDTDGSPSGQQYSLVDGQDSVILTPPAPPSSPVVSDFSHQIDGSSSSRHNLIPVRIDAAAAGQSGSLSDNSHQRSSDKMALLERRQMEERLRYWKRSNKIITHIRENPFDLHMECLERIEQLNLDGKLTVEDDEEQKTEEQPREKPAGNKQQEQLKSYASHLSHLYKKNQSLMDNNSDFRNLLYNIICCLLTQDEQVLASASVTKMIDVIRTHLESASRYYSTAIAQLSAQQANTSQVNKEARRKSSLASLTSCSTSSGSQQPFNQQPTDRQTLHPMDAVSPGEPSSTGGRGQRPADFRRISSVSYNDEQLINDLCESQSSEQATSSGGDGRNSACESPWRYEELASKCKHRSKAAPNQLHSQSSLDNQAATMVDYLIQHDSGMGARYEPGSRSRRRLQKHSSQDGGRCDAASPVQTVGLDSSCWEAERGRD